MMTQFNVFLVNVCVQVEVDVYRSIGPKRAQPLPGASCFFQERLEAWRELNAAADWLEVLPLLHPLCQSLAQLVHHQNDILDIILPRLTMSAALSLEPLLDLIAALARDIQDEFMPHVDRCFCSFSDLIDDGAHKEPEILENIFKSLSMICKHLSRHFCQDLLPVFASSMRLRYHKAEHIRKLSADTFGYLLRHTKKKSIRRQAIEKLLLEAIFQPSQPRLHGTGTLFAASMAGVGHGVNSRSIDIFAVLLEDEIIPLKDILENGKQSSDLEADESKKLSFKLVLARKFAVLSECVHSLLEHVRRGKETQPLWDILIEEVKNRFKIFEGKLGDSESPDVFSENTEILQCHTNAASSLALLCLMIEFYRGSRVGDYKPLFDLSVSLTKSSIVWDQTSIDGMQKNVDESKISIVANVSRLPQDNLMLGVHSRYLNLTFSGQVLRLIKALIYAHCKTVGASEGISAIKRVAPLWIGAIARAPQNEAFDFVRSIITPPSGPEIARLFGPYLISRIGKALLENSEEELCWPLLVDLCSCLTNNSSSGSCCYDSTAIENTVQEAISIQPIVLIASSGLGPRIAELIRSKIVEFGAGNVDRSNKKVFLKEIQVAWAALHCLIHTVPKPAEALPTAKAILITSCQLLEATKRDSDEFNALIELYCKSLQISCLLFCAYKSRTAPAANCKEEPEAKLDREIQGVLSTEAISKRALALVDDYSDSYHAINTSGTVLSMLKYIGDDRYRALVANSHNIFHIGEKISDTALTSRSATFRQAGLRLLCAFDQPAMNETMEQATKSDVDNKNYNNNDENIIDKSIAKCDALPLLYEIESRAISIDAGRPASVSLDRIANYMEYKRIPEKLVPIIIRSLIGILHIRFALLWPVTSRTLGAALDAYPDITWPLIFEQLKVSHSEFLAGDCYAKPHGDNYLLSDETTKSISLEKRFERALTEGLESSAGGCTDAAARLTHVLRSLKSSDGVMIEKQAKDWIPIFLEFSAAKTPDGFASKMQDDASHHDRSEEEDDLEEHMRDVDASRVSPKVWRVGLREWLTVITNLRGLRGIYQTKDIQESVSRHLLSTDTLLQQSALKCLCAFKLNWLKPYAERMMRLADNKTLRSELAAFPLAPVPTSIREGDEVTGIQPEHRKDLIPVVIALLYPKMRKRSGRLSGKGAPGSARAAILNFLSGAEPQELRTLLELFLHPMDSVFCKAITLNSTNIEKERNMRSLGFFGNSWWKALLGHQTGDFWIACLDGLALQSQPLRRRIGYLNAFEDLLKHLGHRLKCYLPELVSLLLVMFEEEMNSCETHHSPGKDKSFVEGTETDIQSEGSKEVRVRCLRLISSVLERFPEAIDYSFLWQRLLTSCNPLMERLWFEVSVTTTCPAVMELCFSLLSSARLMPIAADCQAVPYLETLNEGEAPEMRLCSDEWAKRDHLGSKLLDHCLKSLTSPFCAEPARNTMLTGLENIFDLPDPFPDKLLKPHMSILLEALQAIVSSVWQPKMGGQKLSKKGILVRQGKRNNLITSKATAKRALSILELVGSRASDWDTASHITDALIPLLKSDGARKKKHGTDEELLCRSLAALASLWSRLSSQKDSLSYLAEEKHKDQLNRVFSCLGPLAGSLEDRESRSSLCHAMNTMSALIPELQTSAKTLDALNSMSPSHVDEPDYDKRLSTYSSMREEFWINVPCLGGSCLVYHCCRDLRNSDDLSLRQAASQTLRHLIDAVAKTTSLARNSSKVTLSSEDLAANHIVTLLQRNLFPQLKRYIASQSLAVRQEHMALVRYIALKVAYLYPELSALTNIDEEKDFWLNVTHLQLHRRSRAFARLTRIILGQKGKIQNNKPSYPHNGVQTNLSIGVIVGLIVPIVEQTILDSGAVRDDAGHDAKQSELDRSTNVADSAIDALNAVASTLPWVQYQELLGRWLRLLGYHADAQGKGKALLRAVCTILDAFHFLEPPDTMNTGSSELEKDMDRKIMIRVDEENVVDENLLGAKQDCSSMAIYQPSESEVLRFLSRRVIPELQKQLLSGESARASVALAIIKVLKMMPFSVLRQELPRTIQTVANLLRLRLQRLRDDARAVLVAMASDLGPDYLIYFVEVLSATLPNRGFTAHVLGYTVHAVLEAVSEKAAQYPGSLDDAVDILIPIIENDMFGDVAEAKEVDAFSANYKETKRCKAPETYMLLASRVTFETQMVKLLVPVQNRLADASTPKIRLKLSNLLQNASRGVLSNPTIRPHHICEFAYAIVDSGLKVEEDSQKLAMNAAGRAEQTSNDLAMKNSADPPKELALLDAKLALHQPLLVEFALRIFHQALKKGIIETKDPQAAAQLDPLLPVLIRALRSRHSPSVMLALETLSILVRSEIPSISSTASAASKSAINLLKNCPKTTDPVAQGCFKLLGGMLRHCKQYAPPASQLKFLLGWAFNELEESAQQHNAFSLLKAIVERKLIVPEIYDLMERVQELMVRSQSHQIRQLSASVLLQFLLDYPLGKKRLDQHLQFLLTNTSYEHESGRVAVLDMLTVMIEKFPVEIINGWSDTIFIPVVLRLINDPSPSCRQNSAKVLRFLLKRITRSPNRDRLASHAESWLQGSDCRLVRAAAQVLGLIIDVEGTTSQNRVKGWLPTVTDIIHNKSVLDDHLQDILHEKNSDNKSSLNQMQWQEIYYCLTLVEKAFKVLPEQFQWCSAEPSIHELWEGVAKVLLHHHVWVRKIAGRLIGSALADKKIGNPMLTSWSPKYLLHLKAPNSESGSNQEDINGTLQPAAGTLALQFFRQLDSSSADEAIASQAVKCLVFLSLSMFQTDKAAGNLPVVELKLNSKPMPDTLQASLELENNVHQNNDVEIDDNNNEDEEEDDLGKYMTSEGTISLDNLVRRMVRLADDKSYARQLQRGFSLRFIAALALRLGQENIVYYLPTLLKPIYRITEPGSNGNPLEITNLANEIMSHLRELVGAEILLEAYNLARQKVNQVRMDRKRKSSVLSLVDPEAAAKRKIRAAQRKAAGRKKAMEETRRLRSAGVRVKNRKSKPKGNGHS